MVLYQNTAEEYAGIAYSSFYLILKFMIIHPSTLTHFHSYKLFGKLPKQYSRCTCEDTLFFTCYGRNILTDSYNYKGFDSIFQITHFDT